MDQLFEKSGVAERPSERNTKIICTVENGINCDVDTMAKMIEAGMDTVRINFNSS